MDSEQKIPLVDNSDVSVGVPVDGTAVPDQAPQNGPPPQEPLGDDQPPPQAPQNYPPPQAPEGYAQPPQ